MDLSRCLFHARSPAHAGQDQLVPLSDLRSSDPAAYRRALAKYDDTPARRRLPETWIPLLEARWTEVVFLSPVAPHAIWSAWRDIAGVELPAQEFWAIPARTVHRAAVLDRHLTASGDPIDPAEVTAFDPGTHRAAMHAPARNRDWVAQLAAQGKRGAWFHGTPHVLTAAPVPLASAAVIDWREPPTD